MQICKPIKTNTGKISLGTTSDQNNLRKNINYSSNIDSFKNSKE